MAMHLFKSSKPLRLSWPPARLRRTSNAKSGPRLLPFWPRWLASISRRRHRQASASLSSASLAAMQSAPSNLRLSSLSTPVIFSSGSACKSTTLAAFPARMRGPMNLSYTRRDLSFYHTPLRVGAGSTQPRLLTLLGGKY